MEMEEISREPEATEGESARMKSEGAAEPDVYTKLQSPSEDLYAEAQFPLKKNAGLAQGLQDVRLWRGVTAFLGALCLLLILIIVLLVVKFQNRPSPTAQVKTRHSRTFDTLDQNRPAPIPWSPISNPQSVRNTKYRKPCQSPHCAPDWLQHGDSCFFLSTRRKTWDEARENCTDMSGTLAVITSQSMQNFLTHNGQKLSYWIGLRHDQSSWTWVDGSSLIESYWSDKKSTGSCVLLKGGDPNDKSWFPRSCTLPTYYICELPASTN